MPTNTQAFLDYLHQEYINEDHILSKLETSSPTIKKLQREKKVPKPTYEVSLKVQLKAPNIQTSNQTTSRFYPKGFENWVKLVLENADATTPFEQFQHQYKTQIHTLKHIYIFPNSVEEQYTADDVIEEKWNDFLAGKFGLSTNSGLPKDIATLTIALEMIRYLTQDCSKDELAEDELLRVKHWVNCLEEIIPAKAPDGDVNSDEIRLFYTARQQYLAKN